MGSIQEWFRHKAAHEVDVEICILHQEEYFNARITEAATDTATTIR
jgi:hypothetical protein